MADAQSAPQDPAPRPVIDTFTILGMRKPEVTAALRDRNQDTTGDLRVLRARLIDTMHGVVVASVLPSAVAAATGAGAPAGEPSSNGRIPQRNGPKRSRGRGRGRDQRDRGHGTDRRAAEDGARPAVANDAGSKVEEGAATTATTARAAPAGNHFRGSAILERVAAGSVGGTAVDGCAALLGWLPGPHHTPAGKQWKLQFRATRDGWRNFHRKCDDAGPTLMLVLGERNGAEFVAGGYAAGSWTQPDNRMKAGATADPEAAIAEGRTSFLFSLVDSAGHGPVQLRLKRPGDKFTRKYVGTAGPIFGADELRVGKYRRPLNEEGGSSAALTSQSTCPWAPVYDHTAAQAQGCTTFVVGHATQYTTKELEVFALQ